MAEEKLTQQTEVTSLNDEDILYAVINVATTPLSRFVKWLHIKRMVGSNWIPASGTWSYSSADSPSFVASVPDADAALMNVGTRLKLTQTTEKYFIVTSIGTPSGGNTPVTIYGGTDYTLANAAITSPFFSNLKSPVGFPTSPDKWTVTLSDTASRSQSSPVGGTWYNLGSLSLNIPVGVWRVYYELALEIDATLASAGSRGFRATLSTANNSESDSGFTGSYTFSFPVITNGLGRATVHREKILTLATKTTYYLNANVGVATNSVAFKGDVLATTVKCICSFL